MNFYNCIAFITLMFCITNMVNNFINHIWNDKVEDKDKMKLKISLENEKEEDENEEEL